MAFLQTDRQSIAWVSGSAASPARHAAHRLAPIGEYFRSFLWHWRDAVQRRSGGLRLRAWGTMLERERQRRALARLSDRELRDIGISRYEVEFLLRQSRPRR
jgi:uncharacterized protein YjiS (DUF1127 family)